MTKTLTEQWREGKLKGGMYFWRLPNNETFMATLYKMDEYKQTRDASQIVCLAPVPDYMDCKRLMNDSIELDKAKIKIYELVSKTDELVQKMHILEKRLEIATKALKDIKVYSQRDWDEYNCMECADKALKEMEGVK